MQIKLGFFSLADIVCFSVICRHRVALRRDGQLVDLPHVVRWFNDLCANHPEMSAAAAGAAAPDSAAGPHSLMPLSLGHPSCGIGKWGPADPFELFTQWRGRGQGAVNESQTDNFLRLQRQQAIVPLLLRLEAVDVCHITLGRLEEMHSHPRNGLEQVRHPGQNKLTHTHTGRHTSAADGSG